MCVRSRFLAKLFLAAAIAIAATAARAHATEDVYHAAWRATGVHPALLRAIALTESGRDGAPWPWTLNVAGRGFYFATREDAFRAAAWLLGHGIRNFDVGLMQINWHYNGWRFASLWEALAPDANVRIAAEILRENREAAGSWARAVMWYHSRASERRGQAYLARFLRHFELEIAWHVKDTQ